MIDTPANTYTSFDGNRRIAAGWLEAVALAVKRATNGGVVGPILTFDDATGRSIDIDTEGSEEVVLARLAQTEVPDPNAESAQSGHSLQPIPKPLSADMGVETHRDRGRPKLGVVPREVTLLPRHWEWLATQPGGASVALRKLVDEARRANAAKDKIRNAQERAYRVILALAGDLPSFEEACRALFANDRNHFSEHIAAWPDDVRDYAMWLAFTDDEPVSS